jgi:pimeloyl-ACP methyl ester carboxylesterase
MLALGPMPPLRQLPDASLGTQAEVCFGKGIRLMDRIETRMVNANGLSFETDIAGNTDRLALLLHGFPENKYSWRHQILYLASLGMTVWAPNLRGYGRTSRPRERSAYRLEHLLDDVAGLIDAASAERRVREVTLIGHDWGGLVAWAYAIRNVSPIAKLVVLNMPHPALFRRSLRTRSQLARSWYIGFFQLPWLPETLLRARGGEAIARLFRVMASSQASFSDRDLAVFRDGAREPGALTAMLNYYRANVSSLAMRQVTASFVLPIEVPTLLIWGERDLALGKELTYGTEHYVRHLTIRYLPRASHWVQQEAPEAVNGMIGAFLDGRTVPLIEDFERQAA